MKRIWIGTSEWDKETSLYGYITDDGEWLIEHIDHGVVREAGTWPVRENGWRISRRTTRYSDYVDRYNFGKTYYYLFSSKKEALAQIPILEAQGWGIPKK